MSPPDDVRPGLHVRPARGRTRAAVLLLHGGTEHSLEPLDGLQLSRRRMVPFARALHRQGAAHGVAVWSLAYRVRGWNGDARSPVADARWALDELRKQHGGVPTSLVGHSMGGRVAAAVLDDPDVVAMVGLAPWLPGDPVTGARGKQLLVAHGTQDGTTSPRKALDWVERARGEGATATFAHVEGAGHALLRRFGLWTDLSTGFALGSLGVRARVGRTAQRVLDQPGATLTV
ncbi:MAG TPA: alpha/beta fold hydrolase [Mycobacteriales bacterium]|nr:alpha/beta fold hydrolase [Mycobacteriales bacterium]